ncbi:peptidoglycan DD-metalloendopeptidase family protein [Marinospirillum insulare]|uniref:peptidoglycan DD-metalloendopeptidase family protein n=1 Tax=Marinospirillum insulare TaxID=217169 RepID=UPI000489F03F|nr:peptidoglycan DD-metalloendopeptidase family protein [Marinospirillum insulare]
MLKFNRRTSYGWLTLLCLALLLIGCSSKSRLNLPEPPGHQAFYQPSGQESFADIAAKFNLEEAVLRRFNPRSQQNPPSSQRQLRIPENNKDVPKSGPYYYRIQSGDTFGALAQHFHLALISLLQANPTLKPEKLRIGQRIIIPVIERHQHKYRWPVAQPNVRINFSWQRWGLHQGLALETSKREEIFPIAPGKVIFAGQMRSFGRVIVIKHKNEQQSIYAYCHALFVEQDDYLSGRHPVCSAGKQRQIDKPGIYFELREAGQAVSPENYLPALPWAD